MDERLRAAYDRLEEALSPPDDAPSLVGLRVAQRRRRRRSARAVAASVAAVVVAAGVTWGVQQERGAPGPGPAATDSSSPSQPPRVSESPDAPDPTATPTTPEITFDIDCEGAGWRVGTVVDPDVHALRDRQPGRVVRAWLGDAAADADLRPQGADTAVADITSPDGRRYLSLGLSRIDGWWRIASMSACTQDYPGLGAARVFGSGLPLVELVAVDVGHCWLETLEYGGDEWDLRDEDQFGWGGLGPDGFLGIGSAAVTGDRLEYVDLSGARLTFVPSDLPGTDVNQGGCA